MKSFTYEARDQASNKLTKATVQAESENSAAKLLIEQGLMPLSIKESGGSGNIIQRLTGRITSKDKIVFTRQLATLIGAGLPLAQSLRTITEQTENKQLQSISQEILSDVEGGRPLSEAFGKHPSVFDAVYIALISAGEASGTLDEALKRVAAQKEKDAATMSKIRGAMTYPIIVLVVIMGVMAFMLFTVVPQVEQLYVDLKKQLPFLTQLMVTSADILVKWWGVVLIVLIAIVYFAIQYIKTESGIRFKDTFKLHIPLFGTMFRKLYMARFTRTGQTLLSTGVSMLDSLRITSLAINNVLVSEAIDRATEKVKGGKALSASLEAEDNIMSLVPQMIRIGEQSGRIDEMMAKTAQVFEDELDDEIKAISTAIEPILMVVLAVVAGSMVGAILLPIYQLVNTMNI